MSSFASRLILAAADGASGLSATDAVLCRALQLRPLQGDYQGRDFATGMEGAQVEELYNVHAGCQFEVEAAPSGTAGTAPKFGHLLRACGLSEVIVAGTSVSYAPTAMTTAKAEERIEMQTAKYKQVVRKARGALSFTAEVNRKPFFGFNMLGTFAAPTDGATSAGDFTGWTEALECSPGNMAAFSFGGQELCVRSFSIQDGRTPRHGKFMNCDEVDITARRATGRMQIEWPDRADLDVIAACKAGTVSPLIFELGATAGAVLRVTGPKVQIKMADEQNIDGELGVDLDLTFTADQGDDDYAIIFS